MFLNSIRIKNFRNYDDVLVEFNQGINIIYGDNAQGKTNLLESIYVLGITKSHRSFIDNSLIKENCSFSRISGDLSNEGYKTKMEIDIKKSKKTLKIDNNEVKKVSDYLAKMHVIIFYPDDLELVKGAPSVRRRYLNIELSQLNRNYFTLISEYNNIIKMRNELLKKISNNEPIDENYFDIITQYYIKKCIDIYKIRKKYVEKIDIIVKKIFFDLSGIDGLSVSYKSNISSNDESEIYNDLKRRINKNYSVEVKLGTTLIGPHRDDIELFIGGKDIRSFGSQGQQRMAVLALKLAEVEIFKEYANTVPILLLDDVFSELDSSKKNNLLNYILGNSQTIITTTDYNNLDEKMINSSKLFHIVEGKIINER